MDATLIIVDMQAGFMLNSSCKELIPRIGELLKGVTFTEVVTTKFINSMDSPFVKQLDYKRMLTDEDTRLLFPGYKTIIYILSFKVLETKNKENFSGWS